MKKIISMILVFILGFTFIVGRPKFNSVVAKPKLNLVAAKYKSTNPSGAVYYLPKRDEELEYWLA